MSGVAFRCGPAKVPQTIELAPRVLEVFRQHRQLGTVPEAGGLLFARFDLPTIRVEDASPPHPRDRRGPAHFHPARAPRKRLIQQRFAADLHCVGEWHTHPELHPAPSLIDRHSMQEAFVKSQHDLEAFLLIIVGNRHPELSLWASLHNATGMTRLGCLESVSRH